MITRSEFERLEARVSRIESTLHISDPLPPPKLHKPYTVVIEREKFTDHDTENLDTKPFYNYMENDYHIFVRIYVHGKTMTTPKVSSKVNQGFYEYMYIQNYFNVLIIKHTDLGTVGEHVMAKMNTVKTNNIHMFVDMYKRFSLFFGYSNTNEPLKDDTLFSHGKSVFFIINDHTNNNVRNYVKTHETEFETISNGLASGEIDVYKSKNLYEDEFVLKIIEPPVVDDKKPTGKKFVTKV